ncbi:endonuclease/exonuclease/phosphatase family protein [Flavobacterium sp.]|uniref:endonuclease/exonuclease/phosphatase family protein n=1 Tax=Flavobacterium sp. TaxID=239 RepID=UPI0037530C39
MKIINFNIERLLILSKLKSIIELIKSYDADIIVLTETNSTLLDLGENYFAQHSKPLSKNQDNVNFYREGENRVSIYSKFPIKKRIQTTDEFTSLAIELETAFGKLLVYGTIVGIFGYSRDKDRFVKDFNEQESDFNKIFANENVCLVGDLNISLSGWIYPSKEYRENLNNIINQFDLDKSTGNLDDNIDHILISKKFIKNREIQIEQFNGDKKLSDHIGICLTVIE